MEVSKFLIQWINPLLVVLLVLAVLQGYRKGFLSKLLSCFSFVIVVILAWQLAPVFSKVFKLLPQSYAPYQDTPLADFFYTYTNQILLFVVIVIVASVVLFVLKPIALIFQKLPLISSVNALFGALFGVVEMALLCFAMLFVLHTPIIKNGNEIIENTFFYQIENLQNNVFKFASSLLEDFDFMSESMIDQNNVSELKIFLEEHGYNDEEIQKFIEEIGK